MDIKSLYKIFKSCKVVSTDSRKLPKACLFVALKGERFDGNKYALQALEQGAAYALVSDKNLAKNDQLIQVADTLKILQDLARYHRRQFNIPIIAITGTNGKTTTKELTSTVLASTFKTHFTQGNFNNHIGVPLTLLAMPEDTEMAVIEMGANHIGEIDFLCRIAEPNFGLITNVGKAHLEGFGSFEGVKQTKSEMYRYLAETGGTIFVNRDETHLQNLIPEAATYIPYGEGDNKQFKIEPAGASPFVQVHLETLPSRAITIKTQLIGTYNFNNILTAVVIGTHFKIKAKSIQEALENYIPSNNRSQFIKKETNQYLLDAYNANPTSMRIAIENFVDLKTDLPKIVILGDMLELGKESRKEHAKIVERLENSIFEKVLLVGAEFEKVAKKEKHFKDVEALKDWFEKQNFQNHFFLIKGSRGIKLEKLLQ